MKVDSVVDEGWLTSRVYLML